MKDKIEKKQELREEIEIPEGINSIIENNEIIIKKENEEIHRKLNSIVNVKAEGNKIILSSKKSTKKQKKNFGSLKAHIKNMIKGLESPFIYKLQAVSVHFPMTLKIDNEKNELIVKNFLGEKKDRIISILPEVEVSVNKDIIELKSADIEKAGQSAANIEKGTKIRKRDRRIFQDGIYIIEKPGRKYLE